MNDELSNNKYALLNLKPKYCYLIFISLILIFILLFFSIYYKSYDSFKIKGVYKNNQINLTILENDINNVMESEFLKIKNQKYKFSILSVSEIDYDLFTNASYQNITISTSGNFFDNEILEITFYKNEQRIIKKLINLLK